MHKYKPGDMVYSSKLYNPSDGDIVLYMVLGIDLEPYLKTYKMLDVSTGIRYTKFINHVDSYYERAA